MAARLDFFVSLLRKKDPLANISTYGKREISWIREMMWNLLRSYVQLYRNEYKHLERHKDSVEAIARAGNVEEARRLIALHGEQVLVPFLRAVVNCLRNEEIRPNSSRPRTGKARSSNARK